MSFLRWKQHGAPYTPILHQALLDEQLKRLSNRGGLRRLSVYNIPKKDERVARLKGEKLLDLSTISEAIRKMIDELPMFGQPSKK